MGKRASKRPIIIRYGNRFRWNKRCRNVAGSRIGRIIRERSDRISSVYRKRERLSLVCTFSARS